MQSITTRLMMTMLIGACLAFVGCEGDDSGGDSNVDVTGTWTGTVVKTTNNETGTATLVLTQSGTSVSGTEHDTWTQSAGVQGSVNGSTVSLTVNDDVGTYVSAQVSGNSMTFTWTSGDGTSGTGTLTRQ